MATRSGGGSTTSTLPRATNPLYDTSGSMQMGGPTIGGRDQRSSIAATALPRNQSWLGNIQQSLGSGAQYAANPNAIGSAAATASQAVPVTNANAAVPAYVPPVTNAGNPMAGTTPMTGWAAQQGYTPADLMGMNQMPARYLYDILAGQGMDPTGGLFYMMEPLADVMMPLFELINGANAPVGTPFDPNDISNFMGGMFGNHMTPGGSTPDLGALMGNILGASGTDSVLGSYLNMGTPEEQIENARRYMMILGQMSGSPMYQQALSNQLSAGGYDYLNQFQGGQQLTNTFGQSLGGRMGR